MATGQCVRLRTARSRRLAAWKARSGRARHGRHTSLSAGLCRARRRGCGTGGPGPATDVRGVAAAAGDLRIRRRTAMGHVLVWHLDGRLPNLALMRLAAHHCALGERWNSGGGAPTGSCGTTPPGSTARSSLPARVPWASSSACSTRTRSWAERDGMPRSRWPKWAFQRRGPLIQSLSGVSPQPGLYATGLPPTLSLLCGAPERGSGPARRHDCRDLARGALAAEPPPVGQ